MGEAKCLAEPDFMKSPLLTVSIVCSAFLCLLDTSPVTAAAPTIEEIQKEIADLKAENNSLRLKVDQQGTEIENLKSQGKNRGSGPHRQSPPL